MIKNLIFDLGGVIENLHMDQAERAFHAGVNMAKKITESLDNNKVSRNENGTD